MLPSSEMTPGITVVVPVYNSEPTLPDLIARLGPVLRESAESFEVILVNDGSRDRSWDVIARLAAEHPWVHGLDMMRNYGQHNALLCGIRAARHDVTITLDDDLQHPPEEIPKLLAALGEGYDVVYGPPLEHSHHAWRNLTSRFTKWWMSRTLGVPTIRELNAFRALRTELRAAFADFAGPHLLFDVLLTWGTTRFGSVRVRHDPRLVGRSNYTFRKLMNQTMLLMTGFSTAPLRLASLIGFTFTAFGLFVLAYVVVAYFTSGSLHGFPFLASIIAIFSGAQLFTLGIFGEYLARMFNRSLDRPTYVVRQSVGEPDPHVLDHAHE